MREPRLLAGPTGRELRASREGVLARGAAKIRRLLKVARRKETQGRLGSGGDTSQIGGPPLSTTPASNVGEARQDSPSPSGVHSAASSKSETSGHRGSRVERFRDPLCPGKVHPLARVGPPHFHVTFQLGCISWPGKGHRKRQLLNATPKRPLNDSMDFCHAPVVKPLSRVARA